MCGFFGLLDLSGNITNADINEIEQGSRYTTYRGPDDNKKYHDKNFAVSVKVGEDMVLSIFKPTHGKYGILEGVIKSSTVDVNDIAYTSGVSEIYPSNIPVAKVICSKSKRGKSFGKNME